jgi:hypothetical protein
MAVSAGLMVGLVSHCRYPKLSIVVRSSHCAALQRFDCSAYLIRSRLPLFAFVWSLFGPPMRFVVVWFAGSLRECSAS